MRFMRECSRLKMVSADAVLVELGVRQLASWIPFEVKTLHLKLLLLSKSGEPFLHQEPPL
jgi:hypothetical protein